jgi:hypothetical protein
MNEGHQGHEIADVEARRRGVEAHVGDERPAGEPLRDAFGVLMKEPAPAELFQERDR